MMSQYFRKFYKVHPSYNEFTLNQNILNQFRMLYSLSVPIAAFVDVIITRFYNKVFVDSIQVFYESLFKKLTVDDIKKENLNNDEEMLINKHIDNI